jgi:HEPN domain-containing protein
MKLKEEMMNEKTDKQKLPLSIKSEQEFLLLMEEIDREMVLENIPITARPFRAVSKIALRYDAIFFPLPPNRPPKSNCFDALEISIRIHDWMKQRYGKRLNVYACLGRVVIPLRGALYSINCPIVYGTVKFVCEPHTFGQKRELVGVKEVSVSNILDSIENATPALAQSINTEEAIKITIAFTVGMGAYTALDSIKDIEYIREVIGDFHASVSHLMAHESQPGLSKWASLQAVEKLYKAYISQQGEDVKRTHSLQKLCDQATDLGLPSLPKKCINDVQCSAGVRYGEISVSVEDAVKAHLVSLEICEFVAQHIGKNLERKMPVIPEIKIDGVPLSQFCQQYIHS